MFPAEPIGDTTEHGKSIVATEVATPIRSSRADQKHQEGKARNCDNN